MKKVYILITLLISASSTLLAQSSEQEVTIQLGDTLYFAACNGESYTYIDFYKKTRFEKDTMDFDTIYGYRYFDLFTATGDFDVTRMSCTHSGEYAILKHLMAVPQEDGSVINVAIGMVENGVSMVYMIENAFSEGEVLLAPVER